MGNNMTNTLYLFTDVETTGLNFENSTGKPITNPMLQIAYQLWNSDLSQNIADANYIVKYDNIDDVLSNMDDYVTNMHTSTGLVDKLKDDTQTTDLNTIDDIMFGILKPYADQNYRIMLVGNNIQFDHELEKSMSYETELIEKYGQYVFGKWCAPDDAIYIGRGSIFGNPFPMQNKSHDERLRVCMEYRTYLANKIANNPAFANEVRKLYKKNLVCFCSNGTKSIESGARFCHGHILQAAAHYLQEKAG